MNEALNKMLTRYKIETLTDKINALREIFQELALLGLWRGKFFEKAAFYGGTALRVLYGLDRFSEDMDFSLLKNDGKFSLNPYCSFVENELKSFGFSAKVTVKNKSTDLQIESAFLKADTLKQFLIVEYSKNDGGIILPELKIKIEVDKNPPMSFDTEIKSLLVPVPFNVKVFSKPCLFAGKLHAVLCRNWSNNRAKGRDWYDLMWYISENTPVNLKHLKSRMVQTGHWQQNKEMTLINLIDLLDKKIDLIDINQIKKDVERFISNKEKINIWSKEFFKDIIKKIKAV